MRKALSVTFTVLLAAAVLAGFAWGVTVLNDALSGPADSGPPGCEGAAQPIGDC